MQVALQICFGQVPNEGYQEKVSFEAGESALEVILSFLLVQCCESQADTMMQNVLAKVDYGIAWPKGSVSCK